MAKYKWTEDFGGCWIPILSYKPNAFLPQLSGSEERIGNPFPFRTCKEVRERHPDKAAYLVFGAARSEPR